MKKIFFILTLQLIALVQLYAQNKVITGQVVDSTGPVDGATVAEKNMPSNGVVTDANGKFSLTLKGTSNTIVITAVGFATQQINVAGKQTVKISNTRT